MEPYRVDLNDATPLRTRFGITGLVTDRLSATAAIGYGATFFSNPNAPSSVQYNSFLANADVTYGAAGGSPYPWRCDRG